MKTSFALEENAGLNPAIVAYLRSIPIGSFSYQYYKLRHPGAIYNLMSSKLIDSISIICKELRERRIDNLKSHFRLMVHDLFQFYESCYEIMLCFCKEDKLPSTNEFIHVWLKKNNYSIGEDFYKSVKTPIEDLKYFHNKIKHSSNDVQFIVFKNKTEITAGYFLDMPKEAYKGPVVPTSLSREIKRIYFLIYFISDKLKEVLTLHLKDIHHFNLMPSNEIIKDDAFRKLHESICSLSDFYLLNEITTAVYKSSVTTNTIEFNEVAITEHLLDEYYRDGMNLEMNFTPDEYNNSVFIPFCGLKQIGLKFYYQLQSGLLKELKIIEVK